MNTNWSFAAVLVLLAHAIGSAQAQSPASGIVDLKDQRFTSEEIVKALAPPKAPTQRRKRGLAVEGVESGGTAAVAPQPERRSISMQLPFEFDSARLTNEALTRLDAVGAALNAQQLRDGRFMVSGHSDAVGRYDYNLALSKRRAEAVRDYLVGRHGIEARRLVAVGRASDELIDPADPRSAANRRVQLETMD